MTGSTSGTVTVAACEHCGAHHAGRCHRIKAIDYYPNGTMKRVEYVDNPAPTYPNEPFAPWWVVPPWTLGTSMSDTATRSGTTVTVAGSMAHYSN